MKGAVRAGPRRGTAELFDGVDLRVDRVRADLLGVSRHHRIDQFLHLRAIGEGDALELAGLFQGVELGAVLRGLDLPAVGAGFLAGLDDRGLQLGRKLLEGLAGEADRPDGDRVLVIERLGPTSKNFICSTPAASFSPAAMTPF